MNDINRASPKQILPNLILISRVVSANNVALASKLLASHDFFRGRMKIDNNRAVLIYPRSFAEEFRSFKASRIANVIEHESGRRKPNTSKIEAATRLSRLWKASAPTNFVAAVITDSGTPAVEPAHILDTLKAGWFGTFSRPSPPPS